MNPTTSSGGKNEAADAAKVDISPGNTKLVGLPANEDAYCASGAFNVSASVRLSFASILVDSLGSLDGCGRRTRSPPMNTTRTFGWAFPVNSGIA